MKPANDGKELNSLVLFFCLISDQSLVWSVADWTLNNLNGLTGSYYGGARSTNHLHPTSAVC